MLVVFINGFIGIGYNSRLKERGERLDIIDIFYNLQRLGDDWTLYDASSYAIVNRISPKKVDKTENADDILELMVEELERPKKKQMKDNVELRQKYLERANEITGTGAAYINALDRIKDKSLLPYLEETLNLLPSIDDEVKEKVWPKEANSANKLYLPLEISEALMLYDEGIDVKAGPQTELYFDRAIEEVMAKEDRGYRTTRFLTGPKGPAYLPAENVIWTKEDSVEDKLDDKAYRDYVADYMKLFGYRAEEGARKISESMEVER
ncbi:MAG: hypothetical protein ACQEP1_04005 [Nanobdellota archaeon]